MCLIGSIMSNLDKELLNKFIGKKVIIYEKDYVGYNKNFDKTEGIITAIGDEFIELNNGTGLIAIKYVYSILLSK